MHDPINTSRARRLGLAVVVAIVGALAAAAVSLLPASGNTLPKPSEVEVDVVTSGHEGHLGRARHLERDTAR